MIGKVFGRKKDKDKAIIHTSVPEEVLYPEGRRTSEADTSWMDDVLSDTKPDKVAKPAAPQAAAPTPATKSMPSSKTIDDASVSKASAASAAVAFPQSAANPAAEGRPKFPVGWLVAIEGGQAGEWVPLEKGVSTIGGGAGDTIATPDGSAAIAFDASANTFALSSRGDLGVRLNGLAINEPTRLRDGDVIGLGATAFKLVALCSGNFRWNAE